MERELVTVRINYDTNIEDEEIYLFNEKDDKTPYYEKGTSYNYFDEEENLSFEDAIFYYENDMRFNPYKDTYLGPKKQAQRKEILDYYLQPYSEDRIVNLEELVVFLDYSQRIREFDLWEEGNILHLRGSGKYKERFDISKLNEIDYKLFYLDRDEKRVHLFWAEKNNEFKYGYTMIQHDEPYQIEEDDENGDRWYVWIFPLLPVLKYQMDKKYWIPYGRDYKELQKIKQNEEKLQNAIADQEMLHEINYLNIDKTNYEYLGKARKRQKPKLVNGVLVYNRDRQIALNALLHAGFLCEINKEHPSFIRKNSEKKYMECHHLVPLSYSYKFPDISLDVEENIVCLCSNCHNQLHYGKGADVLLKKLYLERHSYLEKVGIHITLNELLEMYEV